MTSVTTNSTGLSVMTRPDSPSGNAAPPELLDVCGLLTVQLGMRPTEQESRQLEDALRDIASTQIGGELLRAIAACEIPPHERPAFVFENTDPYDDSASAFEYPALTGAHIIHFEILPDPGTASRSAEATMRDLVNHVGPRIEQTTELFADLAAFYAARLGQPCAPGLGFGPYSVLTFTEQLGVEVPQWQRDMEAWVRAEATPDEVRALAWEAVHTWDYAAREDAPLALVSLGLQECPPLQNLHRLKRLILADNRIADFPPADRLPPGIQTVDLAGNPIRAGAGSYGPNLTEVTLDAACLAQPGLRDAFPSAITLIPADPGHVSRIVKTAEFTSLFPETLAGVAPIEAMERAGWTGDVMADLYEKDLLESAVRRWLFPASPNAAWRLAQQEDPNSAFAMATLLDRLDGIAEYGHGSALRERLVGLLTKMQEPGREQFLRDCLAVARNGAESCRDRILDTLNDLHIASLNADVEAGDYDHRVIELLHHGEDMFSLHTLAQFTAELMPALRQRARMLDESVDEVEQFLGLQTRLQGKVYLPPLQFKMQFDDLSLITDLDVERAATTVAHARKTEYIAFLGAWAPLQSVIRRTAPQLLERADKWRDHIYSDRGRLYGWLDRVLKTDGQLFVSRRQRDAAVFNVEPAIFWTRYERLVDQYLARQKSGRDDVQACADAGEAVRKLIQEATVRAFLDMHGLKISQSIAGAAEPRWFKRLRKRIR